MTRSQSATATTAALVVEAPASPTPVSPTSPPASSEAPRTAGCSLAPTGAGAWLLVPLVLLARRRRSIGGR